MKKIWLIVFAASLSFASFAQGKREYSGFFDSYYYKGIHNLNFTANGGLNFYHGDLSGLSNPNFGFGLGVNYKVWPRVMFGAEFHYQQLSSTDNQYNRNIAFTSTNYEFIGYGRFFLSDDLIRVAADRTRPPKFVRTYIVAGIGLLSYNPVTRFTQPFPPTDSIYAKPEHGNGLTAVIPVGLGFSWRLSNRLSLITEAAYRFTFTDYLDDVSKRGNPKTKDGYLVLDFKLQFSPWAKKKAKPAKTTPPEKYEGPKGTETWKNRKPEPPAQKNNNYYEETPTEEQPKDENVEQQNSGEENPGEENSEEKPKEEGSEELK